jgi:hypothetical protein
MSIPVVNRFFSAPAAFAAFQQLSMLPDLVGEADDGLLVGDTCLVRRTITLTFRDTVMANNVFEQTCPAKPAFNLEQALQRNASVLHSSVQATTAEYSVTVSIQTLDGPTP